MYLIYKYLVITFAGLAVIFLILELFSIVSKARARKKDISSETAKASFLKTAVSALRTNPLSKESKKYKLMAAFTGLLLFQLLTGKIIFAFFFAAAVYAGIGNYFNSLIKKQLSLFDSQLIDALGLITNSVRSGQSLLQALENMVRESKPPVSKEFSNALSQVKLGIPVNEALAEMSKRINSNDLRIAVISLNLAKETGGNLGEILTRLSNTMRERRKLQGKIAATTAQGRASGFIVGSVPFLLLGVLYFIEPSMFGLMFSNILGNLLLVFVFVTVSIGLFFINKIVTIDI